MKQKVETWKEWKMKSEMEKRWKKERPVRMKELKQEFEERVNQRVSEILDVMQTAGQLWPIWNDPVAFSAG